jgi:hypothetical protein
MERPSGDTRRQTARTNPRPVKTPPTGGTGSLGSAYCAVVSSQVQRSSMICD